MSTNKHIDVICVVITILALFFTGFFMNGEALGMTLIADGDAGDGQFTANDLNADWDRTSATRITLTGDGGSVEGNGAYIYDGDVHILNTGEYVLSGELTDGSVIIEADSNNKIWILLDGVSLHCDDSAAILIEQAGKVFLTLADGTVNSVSSGAEYTAEAVTAGIDGAIYSRDDLTINGSGSLSVTGEYRHAIVCNDDLVIVGGNLEITAAQDGIHANDSTRLADVNITINAGDDGITVTNDDETGYIYIESGNIDIPACYEGIEAVDITIAGGIINIAPTDDGINACGRGSNSVIRILGGDITIINETGRDADGLDSNGDIYISGGNLFISLDDSGGNSAIDYGSENGGVCKINGGTVIAAGSSSMVEAIDSSSEQCFIMYATSTASAGTTVTLKNEDGDMLLSEVVPCSFSSIIISTPELQMNETCTILVGDTAEEITIDNSSSSDGFGMGGMFGGSMQQGGTFGGGGGRGGRRGQTADDQPDNGNMDAGNMGARDNQMMEMPEMMEIPEMPDGQNPWNNEDNLQNGFDPGDIQGMEPGYGELPAMPEGGDIPPDDSQMPEDDRGHGQNEMDSRGRRGEDPFMQEGQNQDWMQGGVPSEASVLSPDTLILVGVSILILLAGILIALKVKH